MVEDHMMLVELKSAGIASVVIERSNPEPCLSDSNTGWIDPNLSGDGPRTGLLNFNILTHRFWPLKVSSGLRGLVRSIMNTSSAKNNKDEGHRVHSRWRMTPSIQGDAAAAWRDRDLPSHIINQ